MKLDPRIRILLVSLFSVLLFFVDKFSITVGLLILFFAVRFVLKIPFRRVKSLLILSLLVLFIILVQALFAPGEKYLVKPLFPPGFPLLGGMGSLKWDGLALGVMIVCRFLALMLLLPMLTKTTSMHEIAMALAGLGFPYRAAFIITTACNLLPFFEEQARVIMDAQKLRGMRVFEEGSFFAKLKVYPTLVLPLILGAMRKAQLAGTAMDARAFGVYKTRTWLEKPSMKVHDYLIVTLCLVFAALTLWLNFLLK